MSGNSGRNGLNHSSDVEGDSKETQSGLSGLLDTEDLISGVEDLTDLSHGLENARSRPRAESRVTRNEFERKQLLHDLQLLRIELSQKNLVIDNMKAEHISKSEEMEERLNDALHKRQLLQARLESALAIQQDEAKMRQQQTQKDLKIIIQRQQELETVNKRLQAKAADIQYQLHRDVQISEEEFVELKTLPENQLSLREFFSLRLYEETRPLRIECINLREQRDNLSTEIAQLSHKLHGAEQSLYQVRHVSSQAEIKVNMLSGEVKQLKDLLQTCNVKAQRFDAVKLERDRFEKELMDLQKKHSFQQAEYLSLQKNIDELKKENQGHQQSLKLLHQDKEYLQKQLNDSSAKLDSQTDLLKRTEDQLENTKKTREEMYERYVASRDENRLEYERRLQTEMDRIRLQTDTEISKLKSGTKEAYERENRGLREARELATQEREQAIKTRDEAEKRCEGYLAEIRNLESSIDSRISDFQNEARTKSFELDRLQLVYEETQKNLSKASEHCDRLTKKIEVITFDYNELEKRAAMTDTELRAEVRESQIRLSSYERMEKELDDVVMQAAEVEEDDETAERVLFSYGYGANVPTNAKLRMKQSVHLARRILHLEKINTSLQADLQKREKELQEVNKKLQYSNEMLDQCKQPYSYLIEGMQERDGEIQSLKKNLALLENDCKDLENENKKLLEIRKKLSMDLDRLLSHRQEMAVLRQVVMGMTNQKLCAPDGNLLASLEINRPKTSKTVKHDLAYAQHEYSSAASNRPAPVLFTKAEKVSFDPGRYKRAGNSNRQQTTPKTVSK